MNRVNAHGSASVDIIARQVTLTVIIPVESYLRIAGGGNQSRRRRWSYIIGCSAVFIGIAALIAGKVNGCDHIVVGDTVGKRGIGVVAGWYGAAR